MKYFKAKDNNKTIDLGNYYIASELLIRNGFVYLALNEEHNPLPEWVPISQNEWEELQNSFVIPSLEVFLAKEDIIQAEMLLNQIEILNTNKELLSLLRKED